ncbi:hypothetical protein BIV57_00435 [Mangrovactinospora gilvigrisea]|uniref:Methyltransferase domain-containing protein n=1 Tax=Mangrovactinospora gilvigrisea TaxID=1428644 RepID=A0A1J7CCS8_9ACTN|nr:hypothetical protein BIV57_00435 [Mangrovactinospora gilvigrisea]
MDRWDTWFAAGKGFAPITDKERAALADHLGPPAGRTVLDLGCGTGDLTRHLHTSGFKATGADLSAVAVKRAEEATGPDGPSFVQWDADTQDPALLPRPHFQVIVCRLVWTFLTDLGRARLLTLLAPGGRLAVTTPVRERLTTRQSTGLPEADIAALQSVLDAGRRTDLGVLALVSGRSPRGT